MNVVKKVNHFKGIGDDQQALFEAFSVLGIATETYEHPPIFTVEEVIALNLPALIPGQHGKSLFLTDPAGALWLAVIAEHHRADLKKMATAVGVKRFSFGKPALMQEKLRVTPGSVTPFALFFNLEKDIRVILDQTFLDSAACVFHPMDNRFSTVVAVDDLVRFITHYADKPLIMSVA